MLKVPRLVLIGRLVDHLEYLYLGNGEQNPRNEGRYQVDQEQLLSQIGVTSLEKLREKVVMVTAKSHIKMKKKDTTEYFSAGHWPNPIFLMMCIVPTNYKLSMTVSTNDKKMWWKVCHD